MNTQPKKRISVQIAGSSLSMVTDESEDLVLDAAARLDERIREMTKNNYRINSLDAALLCAVESIVGRQRAEKRVRSLEAQLSLAESNAASLRAQVTELESQRRAQAEASEKADNAADGKTDESGTPSLPISSASTQEEKIRALENYLDSRKDETPATREEKIRYIESLLRGSRQ